MMPTMASREITGENAWLMCGNNGKLNRTRPYVPILSRTPASRTDPAVGASTCASGSHVWNGNNGTFTANARKNAMNNHASIVGLNTILPDASADWIWG